MVLIFSQVQILNEAVAYIDQLHHKLLEQIHSVGLPPQLIKGKKGHFFFSSTEEFFRWPRKRFASFHGKLFEDVLFFRCFA